MNLRAVLSKGVMEEVYFSSPAAANLEAEK
jgi:hypothetical protein